MIGIILLVGIVKKNAIMMVDFAIEARARGATPHDAIREACLLRFRPIMMTTMAALFGTLPIAVGWGAGAELRQPLGLAVVGGLGRIAAAHALHYAGHLSDDGTARHTPGRGPARAHSRPRVHPRQRSGPWRRNDGLRLRQASRAGLLAEPPSPRLLARLRCAARASLRGQLDARLALRRLRAYCSAYGPVGRAMSWASSSCSCLGSPLALSVCLFRRRGARKARGARDRQCRLLRHQPLAKTAQRRPEDGRGAARVEL